MVTYTSENKFVLDKDKQISKWIEFSIENENREIGEINYIFCSDNYLLDINVKELKHNTLTDIISFDFTVGTVVSGDVFISIERVSENATNLELDFEDELHRVMIHGILHYCGYKDKTEEQKLVMRSKEDYYLSLRTF